MTIDTYNKRLIIIQEKYDKEIQRLARLKEKALEKMSNELAKLNKEYVESQSDPNQ